MISAAVLGRLLSPHDYGIVGMVTSVTAIFAVLQYMGLSTATVQAGRLSVHQANTLLCVNTAIGAVLTAATVALAGTLAVFYRDEAVRMVALAIAPSFLVGAAGVQPLAMLQRRMQFRRIAGIEVSCSVLAFFVAAGLAAAGHGYWALVIASLFAASYTTAVAFLAASWRFARPASLQDARGLLRFGTHLTAFNIANYFARNFDNVLVGRVWGAAQLGAYSRAYQLLLLPMEQINGPITAVALPLLSRTLHDPGAYRASYTRLVGLVGTLTMPLIVWLIVAADPLVTIVLGPAWNDSAKIFRMLGIAAFVQPVVRTSGWLFLSQSRTSEMFRWGTLNAVIALLAFLIGLPWEAIGVATAYAMIDLFVRSPLILWRAGNSGPVSTRDIVGAIRPQLTASFVTFATSSMIVRMVDTPVLEALLAFATVSVTFFGCMWIQPRGRNALRDTWDLVTSGGTADRS
jgi:PST family polysaccharide transporter